MKINYALIARSLIALLFVVAGIQKVMHYSDASATLTTYGIPLAALVTLIVIIIEIPVALAFAWGYKVRETGYALIAFTALTILVVHRDFSLPMNVLMALKNLAIIGGIMAAITCTCGCDACGSCTVRTKKHHGHSHENTPAEGQQ